MPLTNARERAEEEERVAKYTTQVRVCKWMGMRMLV